MTGIVVKANVRGMLEQYFVAGRGLGLLVTTLGLAAQCIDSNALLGTVDAAYKYNFWDGAVIPIGLTASLVLNGLLLAKHINAAHVLTLPDFYARTYGPLFEVLVSLVLCTTFICVLAGNLVGLGRVLQFCYGGLSQAGGVAASALLTASYTMGGGLKSVVYTAVCQMVIGIIGILVAAAYVLSTFEHLHPPPSVGFPGYIYPNQEVCDEYGGVLGSDGASCVYNETRWGSTGIDNGAWPFGDSLQVNAEMTSVDGLPPFPNAILFNWATIFVLAAGNLSAIDFQQRCMAATAPQTAARGCILAGVITLAVTLPVAYMGGLARLFYGPDSAYAAFEVNTCSAPLGLPTCAQWLPDPNAFLKLCATQFPIVLGAWGLIGIAAASMSTSAGALLAISTIMARNVGGKVLASLRMEQYTTQAGFMLSFARAHVPVVITIGALIAAAYNETGYLLVVAFDIALSSTIAPLLAIVHAPNRITPSGGVVALLGGMSTRVILEFALPKDGSFVLPYGQYAYGYGEGQAGLPSFVDAPDGGTWNAAACDAPRLRDWTGLDSLVSPLVCTALLFGVSAWDLRRMRQGRPPLLSRLVPAHWLVPVVATRSSDCTATTEDPTKTQTATHSHLVLAPK